MYRALKTPYRTAFLEGTIFTNTASAQTFSFGEALWSSAATASSITEFTARETYKQRILAVGASGADVSDGSTFSKQAPATTSTVSVAAFSDSGSIDVGTHYMLTMASRDDESQIIARDYLSGSLYNVYSRQGAARMIVGRIAESSGTYSIEYGANEFTITDNGTGDVTVTFKRGFRFNPVVVPQGIESGTTQRLARIKSISETSFTVQMSDQSAAPQDSAFNFVAYGLDGVEVYSDGKGQPVMVNGRKPRMIWVSVDDDKTTEDIGATLGTATSGGVGLYTLTFTQPFAQTPIVLSAPENATSGNGKYQKIQSVSSTAITLRVANQSNTASDIASPGKLDYMVIGFDSPDVY